MQIAEISPGRKTVVILTLTKLEFTPEQIAKAIFPHAISEEERSLIALDVHELVGLAKLGLETLYDTDRRLMKPERK